MENIDNNQSHSVAVQATTSSKVALKQIKLVHKSRPPQSYVPFLFKNKKLTKHSSLSPAPGQYQTKSDFEAKNDRDFLLQKYHILMENTKKIKQSVIFKSTAKRFNYKEQVDQVPISYSYRQTQMAQSTPKFQAIKKNKHQMHKSMLDLPEKNIYPSIPDRSSKYGYTLGQLGKLKKIVKTQNQLEKQRQTMKQYAKKLTLERPQHFQSSCIEMVKEKAQIIQKVKEKIRESSKEQSLLSVYQSNFKNIKKPIQFNNSKCNFEKISKIIEDKRRVVDSLGPGCYETKNSSLTHNFKPEKFQFFSSSSERFPTFKEDYDDVKDPNYLKRKQMEDKFFEARKIKSSNFRKCLRKPDRTSDKSQRNERQVHQPGPGDYNPNPKLIKSNIGKVSAFDKSLRFNKLLEKENDNSQQIEDHKMISLKMSRQNSKNNFRYKENYNSNHIIKYTQIMQKNKQFLKNKREKMEQSIKKYKTNGQSEYSICSWESRPFSRNEGAQSTLLQSSLRYQN